jgi:translation elongation factor EF-4
MFILNENGIIIMTQSHILNKPDIEGANILYNTIKDLIGHTEKNPNLIKSSAKTGIGVREIAEIIN